MPDRCGALRACHATAPSRLQPCSASLVAGTRPIPEAQELRVRILLQTLIEPEGHCLVANESPPRLSGTSINCRQIAGYRRLGDVKAEHQQLAVDPRRTPGKVLARHLHDQLADFAGNPGTPAPPVTTRSISPERCPDITAPAYDRLRLHDHQCLPPARPAPREQDPKQSIPTAKARPTSPAALQHSDLMAQRDLFQRQFRAASGLAAQGDRD